ncbi:hypothetical protein C100_00465 [Sphingobium sp. C100]|nr:hypothetical protein C100_00465 [Sphingobium sp. C100]
MAAKRWVDEPHTAKGYQSDYDLLIIVNDKRLTDRVTYWAKLEARLYAEQTITKAIRTPINFIIQTLKEVNAGLAWPLFLKGRRQGRHRALRKR